MKKTNITAVIVLLVLVAFCIGFPLTTRLYEKPSGSPAGVFERELEAGVNPEIGPSEMADDGSIDTASFVTHLPLVIIDTSGKEIPNLIGIFEREGVIVRDYRTPGETEDWIDMTMTVVDREDHMNTVSSQSTFVNHGRIKLRGTSSRGFSKKQYGIKLLNDSGEDLEYPLLGMAADENWILSNSVLDSSGIRNYLALGIAGEIFPYASDSRFCEVLMKDGESYTYQGLYLMSETIKQGKNRVDINDFKPGSGSLSYIIRRDRKDNTGIYVPTWGSEAQVCYGWYKLIYPGVKQMTDPEATAKAIGDEISTIEKILYSDDYEEFMKYKQYIDVDSFVDYFILNEYFGSYDQNSTYLYKDNSRKLSMGLPWDYDNAMDNYITEATYVEYMTMPHHPWFEKLVQDPEFVEKIITRYEQLRASLLSDENVDTFIDNTVHFLGNANTRNWSRWRSDYEQEYMLNVVTDPDGFVIDRNRDTLDQEVLRIKDMLSLHADWLDADMRIELEKKEVTTLRDTRLNGYSIMAIVLVILFVTMAALANRASRE